MIKLLDQYTIDKIAAGEVIERPGSVIKELVENSIDAGATAITIEIKEGGMSFIRITDNGCGISKEEVPVAFLRHATSKLQTADDLLKIASLGFRGEALSSIAAVAQVELITKQEDALTGTRYQIHGGKEISNEEIGAPLGTTIVVRNLFYNTPARKKFMKTPATEGSYIYDLVCRMAMSHPDVSFKFIMNGTDKLFTSGNGRLKEIIYHIYGRDITNNLLEINAANDQVKITGYLAKPSISRGNRSFEDYYVNQRYIKSNILTKAIEDAYRTFVMVHKFPFTVINFEIDPSLIDVNIHPAKRELKFINEPDMYDFTYISVRKALLFKELIPTVTPGKDMRPETLAERKVEKRPEPFEANRRAAELPPQPARPAQQKKPSMPMQPANSGISAQPTPTMTSGALGQTASSIMQSTPELADVQSKPDRADQTDVSNIQAKSEQPTPSVTMENRSSSPVEIQYLKEDKQSGKNITNNMVAENIVPYLTQPTKTASNPAEAGVQTNETSEQKEQEPITPEAKVKYEQMDMFEDKFLTPEAKKKHRIIGQLFKTYWLIEYEDKFFIMDQHAAHEKVKFEELMANYKNKTAIPQYLMPPAIVSLSGTESEFLRENLEFFQNLGFQIEGFGGKEYKLSAVPANLFGLDGRELFLEFIGELSENGQKQTIDTFISKLSTMACKAAIKGNTSISFKEADTLIDQLMKLENPYTCPHGRPTLISMTETELEKKFKRIV
ncbi:DNA mismatch repair endonuclease MutL [Clostridium sp. AF15-41]|uniref:DNA mismatch repair endonuclease MutL n=1 Tax=Clostridia TaxID=186801 RepID=UPI000E725F23|nr:DNA mismatch repair endonuclease MutL [Clostridium sp. AF15-41]RJW99226.1 DNA mismatch repair endonuclease MutL [Clostridium sp. AF15-41]